MCATFFGVQVRNVPQFSNQVVLQSRHARQILSAMYVISELLRPWSGKNCQLLIARHAGVAFIPVHACPRVFFAPAICITFHSS